MANFNRSDLDFILHQIVYAEEHAKGEELSEILPNSLVPYGLRTLDGSFNNLMEGQSKFGAVGEQLSLSAPGASSNAPTVTPSDVSNLISDQDGAIPNTAPDAGLSAPFNSLMTYFAQFVGHDLANIQTDASGDLVNQTTAFADLSQVYASNSSLHVFLREYVPTPDGPVATGRLLTGADGGLPTWADIKQQASEVLGIELSGLNVPRIATDLYGDFLAGPNGYPQIVTTTGLVEGNATTSVDSVISSPSGYVFLSAVNSGQPLDAHFVSGDGRVNETVGVTALYSVFQAEHNALVEEAKETILASGDLAFINQWLLEPVDGSLPADLSSLVWNGERLFQVAKFGNEGQYQNIVFNEFGLKVQPMLDPFLGPNAYDSVVDPAITAEFLAVLKFIDSTYTESLNRYDPNFQNSELAIVNAFVNPLDYDQGTLTSEQKDGAIIRGLTRDVASEVDEFIIDALRGAGPVDLAAQNIQFGRDADLPSLNDARREFHQATGDSTLRAYTSWSDFATHLRNPESIVNFIAAYGVHLTLTGDAAERHEAALKLVFGGEGAPADRLAFLSGPASETGVDDIDFWIGGLAEKQMPFGGVLGSTFNHVFEAQMEAVVYADRFHFVARTAGMDFNDEILNGSLAKLLMAHTDAIHLPGDAFVTPGLFLEIDQDRQFNEGLGSDDPEDEEVDLVPLVSRDDPATTVADTNYIKYTGDQHIVIGGTEGADVMVSSEGDDTLWGDGGNDRQEGGYGNDRVYGGAGDDIITDMGGDDVLRGDAGNDVIHGGNGFNVITGGAGKDFIVTGEDFSEVAAGAGDDFILGTKTNIQMAGNEGNDWIEIGTQDGAPGDNFDPFARDEVKGHDIFVGGAGFDEMVGEGGDDIFVGSDAEDRMEGASGFDWVTYKNDDEGVSVDMNLSAFNEAPLPPSNASVMDRFEETEGLSGSAHNDVLRGNDVDPTTIINHGGALGSALTDPSLIDGLQELLGDGVTQFLGGNIILGGSGSDIIEGRGGDDIIDGDKWLNVRISVRANADGTGAEIASFDSLKDLVPDMLSGKYSPGQLVAVREILEGDADFDTAVYSDVQDNYLITTDANGITTVQHRIPDGAGGFTPGADGTDKLTNVERLQFADGTTVRLAQGQNADASGSLTLSDNTPETRQTITVSLAGVVDANGISSKPVAYTWQVETDPGTGIFEDILDPATEESAMGNKLVVTDELVGLRIRAVAIFEDDAGNLERVTSAATAAVIPDPTPALPPPAPSTGPEINQSGAGVQLIRSDLDFILQQIKIAETHAAGSPLDELLPNSRVPLGLRTVSGEYNNLENPQYGAADQVFPRETAPVFQNGETIPAGFDPDGPGPQVPGQGTSYAQNGGFVVDSSVRTISNLIVDQTANNPAAYAAAYDPGADGVLGNAANRGDDVLKEGVSIVKSPGLDGIFGSADDKEVFFHQAQAPDAGLSAPFNSWMTFFGQFFDHGLDLVQKGGSGTVFIPLKHDDPLYNKGADGIAGTADDGRSNFMVLTRATNQPGQDGILGTADDVHEHTNLTSPFVDQNQTYSSHSSHQVFLRAYEIGPDGIPHATGELLENRDLGPDGRFGGGDHIGGMATWKVLKAQARDILGIELTDHDVGNIPLLATDAYGNFIPGLNGFPQVVFPNGVLVEGNPSANGGKGISVAGSIKTGHAFLDDISHNAVPFNSQTGAPLAADADGDVNGLLAPRPAGTYDNELLDAHYVAGDGRVNENIGLTAVHAVFHGEHNRLVEQTKLTVLASQDIAFLKEWLLPDTAPATFPVTAEEIASLQWNGERLFQTAKFATEMQYQHLVFEEFARTMQPQIDVFVGPTQVYDIDINPAIVAEFAHVVYRFGHSMLTETIDRYNADFSQSAEIGLIGAFLNPMEYESSGLTPGAATGAIVRGVTRQAGNEIDEFVTEALRNNLLGLPLDLATLNLARGRDVGVPSLNAARRDFYAQTGDANLKPYTSWADFVEHIKHPESLVNFIAAYGKHQSILDADTMAEKRAAATLLVLGGSGEPADRLDFLNSTGNWASLPNGVTKTGLDDIDFWIGGLAEEIMPFGGMLGSTFNLIFEEQMERLQDSDRFYYLDRTAGMNFLTELEGNSFARMIAANSDAVHLPGNVFLTPGFTLEVDTSRQFNKGEADNGRADPEDTTRADTDGDHDTDVLQYSGDQHIVMGGTNEDDTLISSEGDDTLWGDGGNDRLEGGDGNDFIFGGAGDDIMTDTGGDDNMQGGDGNDVIHGGNGVNLIIAGFGNDFVVSGRDASEVFGGGGNDFILGTVTNEQDMGNEGDDWLESGQSDGAPGDNFSPAGADNVTGNDIYIGSNITDIMNAEGGDDIMVGSAGQGDRYLGASGFDWATFKADPQGVNIDLTLRAFDETPIPPSSTSVMARFESVNGLSGSAHSDILRGDDEDAASMLNSGTTGSVLTNISLISGLQQLLDQFAGTSVTSFGSGNIILGGSGSDIIEGRGGDDLIDGDKWLNVRISVRDPLDHSKEIHSVNSMKELIPDMLSGKYKVSQLEAVREILDDNNGFDTAVFSDVRANYEWTTVNGVTTVRHLVNGAPGADGTDRLTNIERLQFADEAVTLGGTNNAPNGFLTVSDATPEIGQPITVSRIGVTDADRFSAKPVTYIWQVETDPGSGIFEDLILDAAGETARAIGKSFTPSDAELGLRLRVMGIYQDAAGNLEMVFSEPMAAVTQVITNDAPIATGGDLTGAEDTLITGRVTGVDAEGAALTFILRTQVAGLTFNPDGSYSYQPAENFSGEVTFQYVANDGTIDSEPKTVTITVTSVNDRPVATGGDTSGLEDAAEITGTVGGTDADSNPLTYSLVAPVAGLTLNADGTYKYVPALNFSGEVTFQYVANDGTIDSEPKTVTITVTSVNDRPVATGGDTSGLEDAAEITGTVGGTDADSNPLTYSLVAPVAGLTLNADGTYKYVPALNFSGEVTFQYVANDGTIDSEPKTVTITVTSVNDRPVATGGDTSGLEDAAEITGTVGGTDADSNPLTYSLVAPVAGLTLNADGTYKYVPALNFSGEVTFQYVANDGTIDSEPKTVTITVTSVNDRPVATGERVVVVEDGAGSGLVLTNDSDAEGSTLTVVSVRGQAMPDTGTTTVQGQYGTLTIASDGSYSYEADAARANDLIKGEKGTDRFTYQVSDGSLSGKAVLTFKVLGRDEVLTGSDQADRLVGGRGADYFLGLEGRDVLRGGAGADRFDFNSVQEIGLGRAADRIVDFETDLDRIDLRTIDANEGARRNQTFTWVDLENLGAAFTGEAGQLRFANGRLEGDTDGDGQANFHLKIIGHLSAGDVIC